MGARFAPAIIEIPAGIGLGSESGLFRRRNRLPRCELIIMIMDSTMIMMVMNHLHRRRGGGGRYHTSRRQRRGLPAVMDMPMAFRVRTVMGMKMAAVVRAVMDMPMTFRIRTVMDMPMAFQVRTVMGMIMTAVIRTIMGMLMFVMMMMAVAVNARQIFITLDITFAFGTAASTAHGISPDIVKVARRPPAPGTV